MNFVFILGDDVGITDLSRYAAHFTGMDADELYYQTPHLDALVESGIAFEPAYATQLCSPTRAALMTGKLAPILGFTTATPAPPTFYSSAIEPPAGIHPLNAHRHLDVIVNEHPFDNGFTMTGLPTGSPLDDGQDETTVAEALEGSANLQRTEPGSDHSSRKG